MQAVDQYQNDEIQLDQKLWSSKTDQTIHQDHQYILHDKIVKNLDIGDIIGIEGILFRTKTNQLSLKVSSVTLLSKSIRPLPNIKEKDGQTFFSFNDKENRYRYRHLDLIVNPKNKSLFNSVGCNAFKKI